MSDACQETFGYLDRPAVEIARSIAGVLSAIILGVSYVAAFLVLVIGTWWAIRAFIDGSIVSGLFILFFTAPAMAITQAVISLVAIPLAALAEGGTR